MHKKVGSKLLLRLSCGVAKNFTERYVKMMPTMHVALTVVKDDN